MMETKDVAAWRHVVEINSDPYGAATVNYAERWACLMQDELARGAALEAIAKATSLAADDDGITGYMYGCAVALLARHWRHGEELRRWHNLDCQRGGRGRRRE